MQEKLLCPICGQPTRVYMGNARKDKLCGKHADELKKGELLIDEKGNYANVKNKEVSNEVKEDKKNDGDRIIKCIACGKETKPGFFFCSNCYQKYKNKELLVKIKNCIDIEILDESYEGHYVCEDGHIVKSKSERDIDNYLFENNIPHAYEKTFMPNTNPNIIINPDFTLPNYKGNGIDVIIEHWGYNENNIDYHKTKKYKMNIYRDEKVTLICTNEKDMQDYKTTMKRKLATFEFGKINFD